MKKIIRLTENDLHNIVKESVKKVLTELDWKTYRSAAAKTTDHNRKIAFNKKAAQEFNNKYGYTSNNGDTFDAEGCSWNAYPRVGEKDGNENSYSYPDTNYGGYKTNDVNMAQKIAQGTQDYQNNLKGNTTYQKGVGYVDNENAKKYNWQDYYSK